MKKRLLWISSWNSKAQMSDFQIWQCYSARMHKGELSNAHW